MLRIPRLVLALAVMVAGARPAGAQSKRVVAAVFLVKGEPDAEILAALRTELHKSVEAVPEIELLSQGELRMRLRNAGKGPLAEAAVLRCGSDLACIAELGRLAAADELLLVRVGPPESGAAGLSAQILAMESQSQKIARRVKLDLTSVADVAVALSRQQHEIFGVAQAVATAPEAATPTSASERGPPWWQNRALFRYGGIGTASVGGLFLAVGVIYGLKANGAEGDIHADTDQPRAAELSQDANAAAQRANRFLLAGSLLALVGGGLLGWEMFGMDRVAPAVEAGPGGAQAGIILTW
ncbi:MAG: hypothetical protein HYZ27_01405 [Deltaproteobacteria bacterium]|nr:hypothetical protein [Deltaproteobacteria bacterium]